MAELELERGKATCSVQHPTNTGAGSADGLRVWPRHSNMVTVTRALPEVVADVPATGVATVNGGCVHPILFASPHPLEASTRGPSVGVAKRAPSKAARSRGRWCATYSSCVWLAWA